MSTSFRWRAKRRIFIKNMFLMNFITFRKSDEYVAFSCRRARTPMRCLKTASEMGCLRDLAGLFFRHITKNYNSLIKMHIDIEVIFMSELEDSFQILQTYNQQLQTIMMQKQTMQMQLAEIDKAASEIDKADDEIYKSIGPILVKSDKNNVKQELDEMKEQFDIRIKSMEKQETKLKEKLREGQEKIQELVKSQKGAVGG